MAKEKYVRPIGNFEMADKDGELDRASSLAAAAHLLANFSMMLYDASCDILDAYDCKSSKLSRCRQLSHRACDCMRAAISEFRHSIINSTGAAEDVDRQFKRDLDSMFFPICRVIGCEELARHEWKQPRVTKYLMWDALGDKLRMTTTTHSRVVEELQRIADHESLTRHQLIEEVLVSYINKERKDAMK